MKVWDQTKIVSKNGEDLLIEERRRGIVFVHFSEAFMVVAYKQAKVPKVPRIPHSGSTGRARTVSQVLNHHYISNSFPY